MILPVEFETKETLRVRADSILIVDGKLYIKYSDGTSSGAIKLLGQIVDKTLSVRDAAADSEAVGIELNNKIQSVLTTEDTKDPTFVYIWTKRSVEDVPTSSIPANNKEVSSILFPSETEARWIADKKMRLFIGDETKLRSEDPELTLVEIVSDIKNGDIAVDATFTKAGMAADANAVRIALNKKLNNTFSAADKDKHFVIDEDGKVILEKLPAPDTTLKESGVAADAYAVGSKFQLIAAELAEKPGLSNFKEFKTETNGVLDRIAENTFPITHDCSVAKEETKQALSAYGGRILRDQILALQKQVDEKFAKQATLSYNINVKAFATEIEGARADYENLNDRLADFAKSSSFRTIGGESIIGTDDIDIVNTDTLNNRIGAKSDLNADILDYIGEGASNTIFDIINAVDDKKLDVDTMEDYKKEIDDKTSDMERSVDTQLSANKDEVETLISQFNTTFAVQQQQYERRLANLLKAAQGYLYTDEYRLGVGKTIPVDPNTMPYGTIDMIGGYVQGVGEAGLSGQNAKIYVTGKNLFFLQDKYELTSGLLTSSNEKRWGYEVQPTAPMVISWSKLSPSASLIVNITLVDDEGKMINALHLYSKGNTRVNNKLLAAGKTYYIVPAVATLDAAFTRLMLIGIQLEYGIAATEYVEPTTKVYDFSSVVDACFPQGMHAVDNTYDEINFDKGVYIKRIGIDDSGDEDTYFILSSDEVAEQQIEVPYDRFINVEPGGGIILLSQLMQEQHDVPYQFTFTYNLKGGTVHG